MKPDVVIIGGGAIGLLSARALSAAGLRVRILEQGTVGGESSWAGGGILSPLYPWRAPDAVSRLSLLSQPLFPELARSLAAETGIDPEWTVSGLLAVPGDEAARARAWAESFGVRLEQWERPAVAGAEPALSWPADEALVMPEVAQIRNPRLLRALRVALESQGVELREGTAAEQVVVDGDRAVAVRASDGEHEAGQVLVAAGAWSGDLLAPVGEAPPVTPVRGQMILFEPRPGLLGHMALFDDHYLIPRRDGRILCGSTVEHVGYDRSVTEEAREYLAARARARLPALVDVPIETHWAGLRPGNPRETPFVGPHPRIEGLYLNTGHYRNGLTLAPGSARLIRQLMMGEPTVLPAEAYAFA